MVTRRKREPAPSAPDLVRRVLAVNRMTTGELKEELRRLTGHESRTFNRPYLLRRVAFLTQAQVRSEEEPGGDSDREPRATDRGTLRIRDARLPASGSEIVKLYKGQEICVRVNESDFECSGQRFGSLTAVAKAVTGQRFINGMLFFGLVKRKRVK